MEKNFHLTDFNTKQILKNLESKKALCPSCDRRLKLAGALYIYKNDNLNGRLYYVICRKCEYKKEKMDNEKQESRRKLIESRLNTNMYPYACEIIEDPNIDNILNKTVNKNENLKINALEKTVGVWHKNDSEFFKLNKGLKFFARKIYEGELEETNHNNEGLKNDAKNKNIAYALVHEVSEGQRIYAFVSDLEGHPYTEEAFVAALFMVRINPMFDESSIYELYEQIKENNKIIEDFKIQKFTQ